MKSFESIKNTWNKANKQIESDNSLNAEVIHKAIIADSMSVTAQLLKSIKSGLVLISIDILLFLYNSYFYAANIKVTLSIIPCLIISFTMFIYLMIQANRLKQVDLVDLNLREVLVQKIRYFNKPFYWVIQSMALATALLPFAVNLTQESADGDFNINKTFLLIFFYIFVYIFSLVFYKTTHSIYLKQLNKALSNLDQNVLDGMEHELKKSKKVRIIIAIFLLVLTIAGIIAFFMVGISS